MEIQIEDLVESIKRDGIEQARKEADAILVAARAEANDIVAASKAEAERNLENARRDIESSKALILQAQRDAVLSVRKELEAIMERIMADKIAKQLSEQSLAKIVLAAVGDEDPAKYAVEIDEAKASIRSSLAKQVEKGLEIRPVKGAGVFKLCLKDGSGFYDFSDEQIASLLKPFLGEMKV